MIASASLLAPVEIGLNFCIGQQPQARRICKSLSGKVLAIHLLGPQLTIYCLFRDNDVQLRGTCENKPDTTISGTPLSLARLGLSPGNNRDLFAGEVKFEGDIETGRQFQALMKAIEIDWEEQLSRLTGDIAAHQIGNAARGFNAWVVSTIKTLQLDMSEYLQQESRDLPCKEEVEPFLVAVDTLRADVERIELRIKRLQNKMAPP